AILSSGLSVLNTESTQRSLSGAENKPDCANNAEDVKIKTAAQIRFRFFIIEFSCPLRGAAIRSGKFRKKRPTPHAPATPAPSLCFSLPEHPRRDTHNFFKYPGKVVLI